MTKLSPTSRRRLWLVGGVLILITVLAPLLSTSISSFAQEVDPAGVAAFDTPTTSSPISMSQDKNFIWVVNPDDGSVSVLGDLATTPRVLRTIQNVGREPQAVALDTANHAYVVSPPDNGVKVIDITSANPATFSATPRAGFLTTGAEPWNIVASPDGTRIFVANSGQDTITVIRTDTQSIVGSVDLRHSACNVDDTDRRFQPRGLAVTLDGTRLYVARFLSYTKPNGVQGKDGDKEGVVCELTLPAGITSLPTGPTPVRLAATDAGFPQPNGTASIAHPNQLQSIVIYRDQVYLPNIAAATQGPDRFNSSTMAYVNVVDNANVGTPADAPTKSVNLHLGARVPVAGKKKLFFANPWAIGFRNNGGNVNAYVVSAGSDLLVKLNVDATGDLTFTNSVSTTQYIDLADPTLVATSGRNASKNPLGIVIRDNKAFVMNYISRNVSVVNLDSDTVESVLVTSNLPTAGSFDEELLVGKEIFFASRGHFDRPNGATVSTDERLSKDGWQNCASCHFAGLTDGNVWFFGSGPRKAVPLNATWSPHNPNDQRLLNYSAIFDEVQDFEGNIRNTSGPNTLVVQGKPPVPCAFLPPPAAPNTVGTTPIFDSNQGLLIGDDDNVNNTICALPNFIPIANAGRKQLKVTLPGSSTAWPALDAMKEWVRFSIRTPEGELTTAQLPAGNQQGAPSAADVAAGRRLFFRAGCQSCHGGSKWTISNKDFVSPPAAAELVTEAPVTTTGASQLQMFDRVLFNIGTFNLNVAGQGNIIPNEPAIGATEINNAGQKALGFDHNGDGKGDGYNIPSLLAIGLLPPYYHNGACETLICVLNNQQHRTAGLPTGQSDPLTSATTRAQLAAWLDTLDADTPFPLDLIVRQHDVFFDPPRILKGSPVVVGANISLFGTKADLTDLLSDLGLPALKVNLVFNVDGTPTTVELSVTPDKFSQDFGQAVVTTTVDIPASAGNLGTFAFTVDPDKQIVEANENNNTATRTARLRNPPSDRTPPVVTAALISDDNPFNDTDPIAQSTNVQVKIRAEDPDPAGAEAPSGLASYCIVRYRYNVVNRYWEPFVCSFTPLPAPEDDGSFIVDQEITPTGGVVYAFVWVRDNAGNISRRPAFAFISFVPAEPFELQRNDVAIFRIPLQPGVSQTLSFNPVIGDVDVSVFDDFRNPDANRIAVSANNGTTCEEVTIQGQTGQPNRFQVEVHAVVRSLVQINLEPCPVLVAAASADAAKVTNELPTSPIISGPPAAFSEIQDEDVATGDIFLPLVRAN